MNNISTYSEIIYLMWLLTSLRKQQTQCYHLFQKSFANLETWSYWVKIKRKILHFGTQPRMSCSQNSGGKV